MTPSTPAAEHHLLSVPFVPNEAKDRSAVCAEGSGVDGATDGFLMGGFAVGEGSVTFCSKFVTRIVPSSDADTMMGSDSQKHSARTQSKCTEIACFGL
jgi:hypothetical protein